MKRPRGPDRTGLDAAHASGDGRPERRLRRWGVPLALTAYLAAAGLVAVTCFWGTNAASQERTERQERGPPQGGPKAREPATPTSQRPVSAPNPSGPAAEAPPGPMAEELKEEALAVVRQLMADFPNSSDPIGLMGTVYNRFGNHEEAEKWWNKCFERNPKRGDVFAGMAAVAEDRGEHEKALELWHKAQQIDPRLPGVYSGAAATLLEMGKSDEALAELEKELKISPNDSRSLILLGQAYAQRKEYEKAVESLQRAMDAGAGEAGLYYALANAYARLGQKDKADEFAEKFKAVRTEEDVDLDRRKKGASDRVWAARILAQTLTDAASAYSGHRKLQKAEEYLRRAAVLDPRNRTCRQNLVELYRTTGRLQAALEVCDELRKAAPRNAVYQLNTGILLGELQQFDAAEEAIRKAIELAPKRAAGHRALVQLLLFRSRNLPEAKALAEQLVGLEPSARNYALLAEACSRNGDVPGARAALERALALEPNNDKIKAAYKALEERK